MISSLVTANAMRLLKRLQDQSDGELDRLSELYERWALGGAIAVIIGVVLDGYIFFKNPPYGGSLQRWGSFISEILVGLGIVAEVGFAKRESACQSILRKRSNDRLSEAIVRATNAELATERLRADNAWRELTDAEHVGLVQALKASGPPASIRFSLVANDQESFNFAGLISIAFKAAGWHVGYSHESFRNSIFPGILIPEIHENHLEEVKAIHKRVRECFISAKIRFANGWPESYMSTGSGEQLTTPIASVYVGPKHRPSF